MEITAEKRTALGKQNKKLRKDRKVPAVMYGKGLDPINLTVGIVEFIKVFKEAGESTLIDLVVAGKKEPVLVDEIQVHPVTGSPIHVNFHKVNLKEKIKANVPVEIINEEINPFVKSGEGLILTLINEVEVEALPTDLPHKFEIDVAGLGLGHGITVAELSFDKTKVEVVSLGEDEMIVKLDAGRMEEVAEEVAKSEEELIAGVEATKEKKEEEGEEEKDNKDKK